MNKIACEKKIYVATMMKELCREKQLHRKNKSAIYTQCTFSVIKVY